MSRGYKTVTSWKYPEGASVLLVGLGPLEEANRQDAQCSAGGSAPAERPGIMGRKNLQAGRQSLYTPTPFRWCDLKQVPFSSSARQDH